MLLSVRPTGFRIFSTFLTALRRFFQSVPLTISFMRGAIRWEASPSGPMALSIVADSATLLALPRALTFPPFGGSAEGRRLATELGDWLPATAEEEAPVGGPFLRWAAERVRAGEVT